MIEALREAREALRYLSANAGCLRAFEPEVRECIGNTNWQAIAEGVFRADAALAKLDALDKEPVGERERFEEAVKDGQIKPLTHMPLATSLDGEYLSARTNAALSAWQARASAPQEQAQPAAPELGRDPDGSVSIDYSNGEGMLTMSLAENGNLAWAVRLQDGRQTHGHAWLHDWAYAVLNREMEEADAIRTPQPPTADQAGVREALQIC